MSGNYAEQLARPESAALVAQLGSFFQRFGFGEELGRTWAILYLAPGPLSLKEISDLLDRPADDVSAALDELANWSAVRAVEDDQFEVEVKLLRIVASILARRELQAVLDLSDAVAALRSSLKPSVFRGLLDERLAAIEETVRLYEALVAMVQRISAMPMRAVLNLVDFFRAARFLDGILPPDRD